MSSPLYDVSYGMYAAPGAPISGAASRERGISRFSLAGAYPPSYEASQYGGWIVPSQAYRGRVRARDASAYMLPVRGQEIPPWSAYPAFGDTGLGVPSGAFPASITGMFNGKMPYIIGGIVIVGIIALIWHFSKKKGRRKLF